jgi:hypothetical protein
MGDREDNLPLTEKYNGKLYCQGYQRNESDDEPCEMCKECHLNVWSINI